MIIYKDHKCGLSHQHIWPCDDSLSVLKRTWNLSVMYQLRSDELSTILLTSRWLWWHWCILIAAGITAAYLFECSYHSIFASLCMYLTCIWKLRAGVRHSVCFCIRLWCRFLLEAAYLALQCITLLHSKSTEQNLTHLLLNLHCEPVTTLSLEMVPRSVESTGDGPFFVHHVCKWRINEQVKELCQFCSTSPRQPLFLWLSSECCVLHRFNTTTFI